MSRPRGMPALFSLLAPCLALLPRLAPGAEAGGFPSSPRLAADNRGGLFGGYQITAAGSGEFEIFSLPSGGVPASLGRFSGLLAGVAASPDGLRLVLTRDGSLVGHGDDPIGLALPDSRWRMLDLAWISGGPAALHHDNGELWLARPEPPDTWRLEGDAPLFRDSRLARAALTEVDGEAHLVWSARPGDLSRGAVRHLARRNGRWEELAPLPIGEVGAFAVFSAGGSLELAAVVPHPLETAPARLATRRWRDSAWVGGRELPEALTRSLADASDLAAALASPDQPAPNWLSIGPDGVRLDGRTLRAAGASGVSWSSLATPLMLAMSGFLLIQHCRRSRRLSRMFPGRPVELSSRAVALLLDWVPVSLATSSYHLASGNVRIYAELFNFGDLSLIFWISLAALIVYAAVFEGLWGATPGKWLVGIRVRSSLGGPPSAGQACLRNLLRAIDMFPVLFPGALGAVSALLNPGRQRFGDLMAATVVRRHAPPEERTFILASASPRRRELLSALGVEFRVEPAELDEAAVRGETAAETARLLSLAKARAAADRLEEPALVVAADTLVELDGETLGKPADAAEAAGMLSRLSGRSHLVVTGVTLLDTATGQGLSDIEKTEVEMRELSRREIDAYVATGDPLDKAGAYGVQTGFLVKQVRGSLSNVMGLPMEMLRELLARLDS